MRHRHTIGKTEGLATRLSPLHLTSPGLWKMRQLPEGVAA